MARILVTGADGFTGRYLCPELSAQGHAVVGTARDPGEDRIDGVERIIALELGDTKSIARVLDAGPFEYVFHLAAISFVAHEDALAFFEINTLGTTALLEGIFNAGWAPRKVVVASSANVYGRNARACVSEQVCPSPVNPYGASKLAMENLVLTYEDQLPVTIVRPFNYTGVGQAEHFVIPKIVEHFRKGAREIELGNLHVKREFNDVRWVVQVYRRLMESDSDSGPVNLCSGQMYSLHEVLAMMAQIADYEIEVSVNPDFVRANELPELRGDTHRLTDIVGPVDPIPLQETLAWMYAG